MYVSVCGRGYDSLSVCPIRSSIRLIVSDQIDEHTNNPRGGRVVRRCWENFQCRGVLLIWITVGQGPIMLAVGAGGGCLDIFSPIYHLSVLSPSLWETTRYRLKYCLKGQLSLKQPTNQQTHNPSIRPSPVYLSVHPSISINCLKLLRTFSACPMTMHMVGLSAACISGCSKWH